MALPDTDLGWVDYLARRHDAEKPELEALDRYYEGTQALTYMHPEIFREVADRIRPVIIAWPQLVVDTVEERLDVEGFRLPDEDSADDDLWRVWQSNDLDETSQLGHVDALVMRRSYAAVGTNEADRDTPLVTMESPLEVFADIDPRTRKVRAALRRVVEEDSIARVNERFATLYLPQRTVWFRWGGGKWVEEQRDEHLLGEVPVVPLVNRARLRSTRRNTATNVVRVQYGVSELAPIIPLSDAANKLATDMMLAAEFVAIPLRGFWGLEPGDLEDEQGNKLTALQAIMGRLLTLSNTEGKEFQFPAASLSNFHDSINQLAKLVASVAGLPPHYLGYSTDNPASADAIRSAEARLVKRAERKQRAFGGSWEQVMRLVRRFQSGEFDPRLLRLETIWRDASTPTVAQVADAVVKKHVEGIITTRQAREDLGYTQAQIARMEADEELAASRDPVAEIARGLSDRVPERV
ncbi:MAG TPA: phage portal protein [Jiangellales bacterium]|nr:phage portal protein [Jiangellales bacterium]